MQEADIALWRGSNVRHRCIDLLRSWTGLRINREGVVTRRKYVPTVPLTDDFDKPSLDVGVEGAVIARETVREVHALVAGLPEKERIVIEAIYFGGMGPKEVARRYGYSRNSVMWWHKRALRRMREAVS